MMARGIFGLLLAAILTPVALATINAGSKNNVAVYYGQGPNQKPLSTYCADPDIDIIILSFVHLFPQQANGYPGINFGNQCGGDTYPGPGYGGTNTPANNQLLKCPALQRDLNTCRQAGNPSKKILLSLGGDTGAYQLTGVADGEAFASLLWSMFGPRQDPWVSQGHPRPFDLPGTPGFVIDGFDLDIEHPATDASAGYRALVAKLRELYTTVTGRTFYLTASPQCVVPDANLKDVLAAAQFDILFVQFYNTPQCSARSWANANANYKAGSGTVNNAGFTFDAWAAFLAGTKYSQNARLYIGLPGSAAAANAGSEVSVAQAQSLASAYYCRPSFGGVAVWEATYASANVVDGKNFYQAVKAGLNAAAADPKICSTSSTPTQTPQTTKTLQTIKTSQTTQVNKASPPVPPPAPAQGHPATASPSPTARLSTDGQCGTGFGTTCGSPYCCSQWSWCGSTSAHCGTGCQKGFGKCN
ncbi:carbohydrate-binding module family 18 protein [Whalleya microplaca]|nr:carbohydrate-binding module family 18 protein [Whalleya microplaca]